MTFNHIRFVGSIVVSIAIHFMASGSEQSNVAFASAPSAQKTGDKVVVSFSLSGPTDVEIAVLASDGRIVRQLAAGVLGAKNPPPAPLKPGLCQSLEWDGKDDLGNSAIGGPFKIRARAGMNVEFGKIIGGSAYTGSLNAGPADSLAVGSDGTLYVKMGSFTGGLENGLPWQLRKFDKAGKYVKTLLPCSPSTALTATAGFKQVETGEGLSTPANKISSMDPVLYSFGDNIYNKIVDGSIVFLDKVNARLTFFRVDGSNSIKTVSMRTSPDKLVWASWLSPQLAFSPDGKFAYYSNVANTPYNGTKPSDIDPKFPQGRVYRQDLNKSGTNPEPFYDLVLPDFEKTPYWMPSAWDKKSATGGIAVDAKGNIFVCDLVNQEVVELSLEGKKIGSAKVPWPDKVLVSTKTDTIYVVSTKVSREGRAPSELLKITGHGTDAKIAARLALKGDLGQSLTIDESSEVPTLLVGGGGEVRRVEDHGVSFTMGDNIINCDKNAMPVIFYVAVDPQADLVYATGSGTLFRYNGETGEGGPTTIKTPDVAIGAGGMIYAWTEAGNYEGPIARFSRDLKPAPLASTGKHTYGNITGRMGRGISVGGMAVDMRGGVYAFQSVGGDFPANVIGFDAEGKLLPCEHSVVSQGKQVPVIISGVSDSGGGIRVDSGGNIYLGQRGYPKDFQFPKGFAQDDCYKDCGGTIVKFSAKGGERKQLSDQGILGFKGALQGYPGMAPMSGAMAGNGACNCTRPRFDLDGFGRLYIPNAITYKVTVVDNAGNEIVKFGGYGNFDAQGPKSSEPKPEIPLGWPVAVGASDKHIYVGDTLNHRIVRCDKKFAVSATCVLP
jgi:DNA-binding beta-propeller fold protein YncE